MRVNMIVAVTRDGAIGRGGDQPYYISGDLRRFKALTMGHPVVMGRRTFEALPRGPLPGRTNIVVTRNTSYSPEGVIVASDPESALTAASCADGADEVFIIGGGSLYDVMMRHTDVLHLTEIDAEVPDADTRFPSIDRSCWREIGRSDTFHDERNGVDYRHLTLVRSDK